MLRFDALIHPTSGRNCPKSLGGVYGAAVRNAEKALFGSFALLIAAKSMLGALFEPLFGQFRKAEKANFMY
jgi:hypothetical protein